MKDQWKCTVLEGLSCMGAHMALEMVWSNKRFPTAFKCTVVWSLSKITKQLKDTKNCDHQFRSLAPCPCLDNLILLLAGESNFVIL